MLTDVLYRLRAILRHSAVEHELDEEVRFHIERETTKHIKAGLSPEEASRRARLLFGGLEQTKERSRDARGVSAFENAFRNLRFGMRVLLKSPGFTIVAVLSLALGIGANTAIFQLLDAVRLRTLPVNDPGQLVEIHIRDMKGARGNFRRYGSTLTNPIWEQIRDRQQILSCAFAWSEEDFDTSLAGETHPAHGVWVSGDFFDVLGVHPILGRLFVRTDDRRGCGLPGAVISYEFWQRQFGGERNAIGRKLTLNGHAVEVIGITPASFYGLEVGRTFEVALPLCSDAAIRGKRTVLDSGTTWWLVVMGRMKPGSSLPQVSSYFNSLSPALFQTTLPPGYPPVNVRNYLGFQLQAVSAANGMSYLRERYSDPLWLLLAISGVVLLIACANLANLMLARASARERDIALRLAIGASRGRVIQQLMTESFLIAAAGAGLGLLLALALSRLLVTLLSTSGIPIFIDLRLDWRMFAFTAASAVLTCILFGMTPALRATRHASAGMLNAGGRGMTASRERFGLRRLLVASQVALSLLLLAGALLFVRTLHNLTTVSPGFTTEGVLIADVDFDRLKLPRERIPLVRRDLLERLNAIPGVASAADTGVVPLSGSSSGNTMWMDGEKRESGGAVLRASIGTRYFKTLRIPLLAGRYFDEHDTPESQPVAIVNKAFTRRFLNGANPVGKRLRIEATPSDPETVYEIVGLSEDTKYITLREDFQPIAFFPTSQDPRAASDIQVLIRSSLPMDNTIAAVKNTIRDLDPAIKFDFRIFGTQIQETLLSERLMASLSSAFAFLAGLLAAIGLYGVITYMIVQRQHEIGIRMALGAKRGDILAMVLGESGKLLAVGLAAGAVLTLMVARTASSMLYGLQPTDVLTLSTAVVALAVVALGASYLPARRAATLDPLRALRDE